MSFATEANIHPLSSSLLSLGWAAEVDLAVVQRENVQLRLIADELGHRIKNIVAVIQSIARQTMHQTMTKEDFEVSFLGRMGALSRSLDLLIHDDRRGARIDEFVRQELTSFGALDAEQISVKGPRLDLRPEAARHIGLALHELATNAIKYGALSVPDGKVAVHWDLPESDGQPRFLMSWCESGGPMVTVPRRWGFGRQLIQEIPAQALAGTVTHDFLPQGVRWTLDIPAALVVATKSEPANMCLRNEAA